MTVIRIMMMILEMVGLDDVDREVYNDQEQWNGDLKRRKSIENGVEESSIGRAAEGIGRDSDEGIIINLNFIESLRF